MYLSLDPEIIDDKSRYMRFVIKGIFKTDIKEQYEGQIIHEISEEFKSFLSTKFTTLADMRLLEVELDTPKTKTIKTEEKKIILYLARALRNVGLSPDVDESIPAIKALHGYEFKSIYDHMCTAEYYPWDKAYTLSVLGYKKTGGLWTLRRETAEDFSYTNIANKIKNFIEIHNRIF